MALLTPQAFTASVYFWMTMQIYSRTPVQKPIWADSKVEQTLLLASKNKSCHIYFCSSTSPACLKKSLWFKGVTRIDWFKALVTYQSGNYLAFILSLDLVVFVLISTPPKKRNEWLITYRHSSAEKVALRYQWCASGCIFALHFISLVTPETVTAKLISASLYYVEGWWQWFYPQG